tara:strand:- start:140 stop:361 length:222 start_codon:yes stop_codon:yes gene_type:complete
MSCTDTTKLRGEFEAQLKDADAKIAKVKEELVRLNEYRTKLQGGLETLGLLDEQNGAHEHPAEEAAPEAVVAE